MKAKQTYSLDNVKISNAKEINIDEIITSNTSNSKKEEIEVKLNSKSIKAMVYIMNPKIRKVMPPDVFYLRTCLEGYKDFGFDTNYLFKAYEEARNHE